MLKKEFVAALVLTTFVFIVFMNIDIQGSNLQSVTADMKVKIDLYCESLCPDCISFILSSLKTAANAKDFWKICQLNVFPYGNAKRAPNGTSWSFTCQHGVNQCRGNLLQACAIKKYDHYTKGLPFFICLEENTTDLTAQGQRCATKYNIDWSTLNACATGAEGNKIMYDMAVDTEKLSPPHQHTPWLVVNNKHTTSSETAVIQNMLKYVCSIYTGTEKIDACK